MSGQDNIITDEKASLNILTQVRDVYVNQFPDYDRSIALLNVLVDAVSSISHNEGKLLIMMKLMLI